MTGLKTYSTRAGTRFPPGASATAQGVNFSVFSKSASRVELLLYDAADSPKPLQVISLDPDTNRRVILRPNRRTVLNQSEKALILGAARKRTFSVCEDMLCQTLFAR